MEKLPSEIIEDILSRLPSEAALFGKRVSKTWRQILRHKTVKPGILFGFSHAEPFEASYRKEFFYGDEYDHYDHQNKKNYYYSYDTLTKIQHGKYIKKSTPRNIMVGSCNGLVCFGRNSKDALGAVPFLICNPLTGESVVLPEYNYSGLAREDVSSGTTQRHHHRYGRLTSGFGYCPSTNEYKVVTIYFHAGERMGHVQVYTVGGEHWRYIGFILRHNHHTIDYSSGIYAHGVLYWLHKNDDIVQESEMKAFDLERERFRRVWLPVDNDFEYGMRNSPLKLLGGNNNLYLVHNNNVASRTDIWVYNRGCAMEERNKKRNRRGEKASHWDKKFRICCEASCFTPFAITRNNQVLLWCDHRKAFGTKLYCYDPKTSTLSNLWDDDANGMNCSYIEAIPHTQSIVSLRELGETDITSLKDLENLMLHVDYNGFRRRTDRDSMTTTLTPATETTWINHEGEEKPAGSLDAKRSKKC